MTKNDIAVELCKRIPDLPKSTALHAVEGVVEILSDAFARGENVYLRGFGTLEVKTTKEKKARNINAGTTVIIPAQRTVKFKVSKQLKDRLNNGSKL
ncbi:integration host factor subunit beta [Muribaculaceae bacterium Isolate-084 (Janvier)]|nr:integration host factor subunit beta [Muribaculaceae bacterium Isolate-077 (Janvier)]ROT02504.1 integration host factor subunit beta [Muribaculaceae bacterium Isolate-084 (Janvier)]